MQLGYMFFLFCFSVHKISLFFMKCFDPTVGLDSQKYVVFAMSSFLDFSKFEPKHCCLFSK